MDIYPSYWDKMSEILKQKEVISIDKVKNEIYSHEDDLTSWCKSNISDSFWVSTSNIITEYAEIQNWAQEKNYNNRALIDFADSKNADPFLVAFALNQKRNEKVNVSIVTREVSAPESKRSVKIPDVCAEFGIPFIDNNDFFRAINVSF